MASVANHRPAFNPGKTAIFDRSKQHRNGLIGKINVGRHKLEMHEDDYRQLLFDQTGKISLRAMDERELEKVAARLVQLGFKPVPKAGKSPVADHKVARKARALWISLWHLGVVHNPSEQALEAMARRQLGCDKLAWIKQQDGYKLIEMLKAWAEKAGWAQDDPEPPAIALSGAMAQEVKVLGLNRRLAEAILAKLKSAEAVPAHWDLATACDRLGGLAPEGRWTLQDYTRAAQLLGAQLREAVPNQGENA